MDGENVLLLGDALDLLRTLDADSFGGVIADPPYSSGGAFRGDRQRSTRAKYTTTDAQHDLADFDGDTRDQRSYTLWTAEWMRQARKATRAGGVLACFTDWRQLAATTDAAQIAGWVYRGVVTWHKRGGRPQPGLMTGQSEFCVIASNGPAWWVELDLKLAPYIAPVIKASAPGAERWHMTQKPLEVVGHLLKLVEPGTPVLDPFAGSCTTLIAAAAVGRNATGFEVNASQHAVATQRLATEAPQPPLFVEDAEE